MHAFIGALKLEFFKERNPWNEELANELSSSKMTIIEDSIRQPWLHRGNTLAWRAPLFCVDNI